MLIEPLLTQLQTLGLRGMSRALEHQQRNPEVEALPFEDRLTLLLQHEHAERQSTRLAQRLRWARLPQTACIEDIDARTPRGLERGRLTQLTDLAWVDQHLNVLLSGPTGVGKSYLACALAHQACRQSSQPVYPHTRIPAYPHTRKAYLAAASEFSAWCEEH